MPFSAKSAIPCGRDPVAGHLAFDEAAAGGSTLFTAPPGYLLSEGLAEALQRRGRTPLWVRVGSEDGDPGTLLVTLLAAARRLDPDAGTATLELTREQPGPLCGWPQLFRRLGEELGKALGGGALVLEDVHHLNRERPTLALVVQHLLPPVADAAVSILTSNDELPPGAGPQPVQRLGAEALRLAPQAVRQALECAAPGLGGDTVRRATKLCLGQAASVAALCASAAALGPGTVERVVGRAGSPARLLELLAEAWLLATDESGWRALGLALQVEYVDAALIVAAMVGCEPPPGPWLQPLADGWSRVRPAWRPPLGAVLRSRAPADDEAVRRVAGHLLEQGAPERAVPLYLHLGDADGAARAIAEQADRLLDLGQWETLGAWLDRLPAEAFDAEPRLLYSRGEVAAARGQAALAERHFALAAAGFSAGHDPEGACRSMLAESTVAAGRGSPGQARARALAASALAEAAALPRHQTWACWQLGVLATSDGSLDDALVYFDRAGGLAAADGDPQVGAFLAEAERLARSLQELGREREALQRAYASLQAAEQAARARLLAHTAVPRGELQAFLGAFGWSATPPVLKLAATPAAPAAAPGGAVGWWARMRRALLPVREAATPPGQVPAAPPTPPAVPGPRATGRNGHPPAAPTPAGRLAAQRRPARDGAVGAEVVRLTAHLLGTLRVTLNDVPVSDWPSRRGRALLQYLLVHRDPWSSREMLMEAFWPGAAPEAARNSLNVAVHGLRRALRTAADVPVVILDAGTYRLHPDLRLWLDVDEFERHVHCGRRLQEAGDLAGAITAYELAVSLYQGDFLADDLYEEWPVLHRERFRLTWLDTLDRLSHLYFGRAQYASCANLSQRIVERDACREDAHRLLMRCYARQGQPHLALRQFRTCAEALREQLGVEPAPATVALDELIRNHEPV
jgi:DNA-binding SARP family transcriptional activator